MILLCRDHFCCLQHALFARQTGKISVAQLHLALQEYKMEVAEDDLKNLCKSMEILRGEKTVDYMKMLDLLNEQRFDTGGSTLFERNWEAQAEQRKKDGSSRINRTWGPAVRWMKYDPLLRYGFVVGCSEERFRYVFFSIANCPTMLTLLGRCMFSTAAVEMRMVRNDEDGGEVYDPAYDVVRGAMLESPRRKFTHGRSSGRNTGPSQADTGWVDAGSIDEGGRRAQAPKPGQWHHKHRLGPERMHGILADMVFTKTPARVERIMRHADDDGDGFLTFRQLRAALHEAQLQVELAACRTMHPHLFCLFHSLLY